MIRQVVVGAAVTAALVGGSIGGSQPAQAQLHDCQAILGSTAACGEVRYGQMPGLAASTVIVTDDGRVQWSTTVVTHQPPSVATQAAPQAGGQAAP
jgi:hypothetical protein